MSERSLRSAGQVGYEAYAAHTGGKTFDGRPMPTWDEVKASGTKVAGAWEAAAAAILGVPPELPCLSGPATP